MLGAVVYGTLINPPNQPVFTPGWFVLGAVGIVFGFFHPLVAAASFTPAYLIAKAAMGRNSEKPPTE